MVAKNVVSKARSRMRDRLRTTWAAEAGGRQAGAVILGRGGGAGCQIRCNRGKSWDRQAKTANPPLTWRSQLCAPLASFNRANGCEEKGRPNISRTGFAKAAFGGVSLADTNRPNADDADDADDTDFRGSECDRSVLD